MVEAVVFGEADGDDFGAGGGDVAAYVVGADGEFAVAPVNHHRQLYLGGAAEIVEGVQGGADGAPGVQHIVHQHEAAVLDAYREVGAVQADFGALALAQVVAVEVDVQRTYRHGGALVFGEESGEAVGQRHAAAVDAHQQQAAGAAVALQDFVGDAG